MVKGFLQKHGLMTIHIFNNRIMIFCVFGSTFSDVFRRFPLLYVVRSLGFLVSKKSLFSRLMRNIERHFFSCCLVIPLSFIEFVLKDFFAVVFGVINFWFGIVVLDAFQYDQTKVRTKLLAYF